LGNKKVKSKIQKERQYKEKNPDIKRELRKGNIVTAME
jgi:hypothetical protein